LRDSLHSRSAAGMAGNKNQLVILHAVRDQPQIIVEVRGMPIFVDAEECDVEIVARIGKVVGSPPKNAISNSGAKTRRTSVYFLYLLQVINLTGIKGDHVAAQPG